MFYDLLLEKRAARGEANYHSRYLSEAERRKAFDMANRRRAARETGRNDARDAGTTVGAIGGGLGGLALGGMSKYRGKGALIGAAGGALVGAGLGRLAGSAADRGRDRRTAEARQIMKMSPTNRGRLLDHKRARRLEYEDRMRRMEERAHREQIRRDLRDLKNRPWR